MAPTVKLGPTGIWIHRRAFEAAEANFLSGGGIQILKTNSQAASVLAPAPTHVAATTTQHASNAGGKKKKGKSHKKSPSDAPVSPSPVQDISSCPSKSPTPDIRVSESPKELTKDESGHKVKASTPPSVKVAEKESHDSQRQVQSQKEQEPQPVQQSQPAAAAPAVAVVQQSQSPPQQQQQQQPNNANLLQVKSKSKRKKNKSQSESISEDSPVIETKEQSNDKQSHPPTAPAAAVVVATAAATKTPVAAAPTAPVAAATPVAVTTAPTTKAVAVPPKTEVAAAAAASVVVDAPAVKSVVASQIQQVREQIDHALGKAASSTSSGPGMDALVAENKALKATVDQLVARLSKLELRVTGLEGQKGSTGAAKSTVVQPPKAKTPVKGGDDDDDVDLFASDDDEEANAARDQRLKEYADKKAKKPGPIAKSSIVLDIKPWDDETDMVAMEKCVRSLAMDGLVWGASKLVPIAYGVKKLQIVCVIEDEKVGVEDLSDKITEFEDFVQSVDVAAFNKI